MRRTPIVVVAVLLGLVGCGAGNERASGTSVALPGAGTMTPSVGPQSADPSGGAPVDHTFGPKGWRGLRLGMTPDQAEVSLAFSSTPDLDGSCRTWPGTTLTEIKSAVLSPTLGGVAIIADPGAPLTTPEGMEIGWSAEQVAAAYKTFTTDEVDTPDGALVDVPRNEKAYYRLGFDGGGNLVSMILELVDRDCFG